MAGISTEIKLNDGMTGVLTSMYRGLSQLVQGFEHADRTINRGFSQSSFDSFRENMASAIGQMAVLESSCRRTENAAKNAFNWNSQRSVNIFEQSGAERLKKEIRETDNLMEKLIQDQEHIKGEALGLNILPQNAQQDILKIDSEVRKLTTSMNSLKNIDKSTLSNRQTNAVNTEYENLRRTLTSLLNLQSQIRSGVSNKDLSTINSGFLQLQNNTEQAKVRIRGLTESIQQMNNSLTWQNTGGIEIFTNKGAERMKSELNSMRIMSERLINVQREIGQKAASMRILPTGAASDIEKVNKRVDGLKNSINRLERQKRNFSKWDTASVSRYNALIEGLRTKMFEAEHAQRAINTAIRDNDITRLNSEYQRLNSIVNSVDSSIRDNTVSQNLFNNSLKTGNSIAQRLGNNIKGFGSTIRSYVGMYLGLRGLKGGINAVDTYASNSARLGLITKNLEEQKQLQIDIYKAAQRSRGSYNDMVDVTAKLGLLAGDAFKDNKELVKFTELMNKSFKISGASATEQQAAMYQLTQAMASGRLQGDEFRSIIENAPMLANAIGEYTGVGSEGLKKLSSDGAISADVIKNSLFIAAQDIETKYAELPKTFNDYWTEIKNSAVMNASLLMEDINMAINTEGFQNFVNNIKNSFGETFYWLRLKTVEFKFSLGTMGDFIPSLSEIKQIFFGIGNSIFSANGFLGRFTKSLASIAGSKGFKKSMSIIAGSFSTISKVIGWTVQMIANLNGKFSELLPTITTIVIWYGIFQKANNTLQSVVIRVANSVYTMSNRVATFSRETLNATLAQRGLNAALNANPYIFVASAIMTVVSAMGALIGSIKAVNSAAGIVSNLGSFDTEVIERAKREGVSYQAARQIIQLESDAKEAKESRKIDNTEFDTLSKRYQSETQRLQKQGISTDIANAYYSKLASGIITEETAGLSARELTAIKDWGDAGYRLSKYKSEISDIDLQLNNGIEEIIKMDKEQSDLREKLKGIDVPEEGDVEIVPPSNFNVDKVGEVDKINDTVDIASEDLKYWREIAEQDAINKFITNTLVPQTQITFSGDIKETVDIEKMADIIAEKMQTAVLMSAQGLHN